MEQERNNRVEQLLREAHISRMRGQHAEAEGRCREALGLNPEDVTALEMLGDLLKEKGSLDEAAEYYRTALVVQPGRPTAETKLARVVLEQGERQRQKDMAQLYLVTGERGHKERKRNIMVSFLLSFAFAGGGQFYNGEWIKGALILGVWLLGVGLGYPALFKLLIGATGQKRVITAGIGWEAVLGFAALFAHVYSLIDAPSVAQKRGQNRDFI